MKENLRESQKLKAQVLVTMRINFKNANEDDEQQYLPPSTEKGDEESTVRTENAGG